MALFRDIYCTSLIKVVEPAIAAMQGPHSLVRSGNYARFGSSGKLTIRMMIDR